jgi:hypothetical protein
MWLLPQQAVFGALSSVDSKEYALPCKSRGERPRPQLSNQLGLNALLLC